MDTPSKISSNCALSFYLEFGTEIGSPSRSSSDVFLPTTEVVMPPNLICPLDCVGLFPRVATGSTCSFLSPWHPLPLGFLNGGPDGRRLSSLLAAPPPMVDVAPSLDDLVSPLDVAFPLVDFLEFLSVGTPPSALSNPGLP